LDNTFEGSTFCRYDSYNATEIGGSCASIVEAKIFPVSRILARYAPKLIKLCGKDTSLYVKKKRYISCFFLKETFTSVLKQGCTNSGHQIVEAITGFAVAILSASPQYGIYVLHSFYTYNFQVSPTLLENLCNPQLNCGTQNNFITFSLY
jgi:hypothetical protein